MQNLDIIFILWFAAVMRALYRAGYLRLFLLASVWKHSPETAGAWFQLGCAECHPPDISASNLRPEAEKDRDRPVDVFNPDYHIAGHRYRKAGGPISGHHTDCIDHTDRLLQSFLPCIRNH